VAALSIDFMSISGQRAAFISTGGQEYRTIESSICGGAYSACQGASRKKNESRLNGNAGQALARFDD
jgi:hypothetical protein